MDFRASGNRFIPLLDQIFALLATPFPVPHPPAYQRLLRSYTIATLCQELGLEVVDTGPIAMSLHLEHMTLLWIKMARVQGAGAGFVWAQLLRPREAV